MKTTLASFSWIAAVLVACSSNSSGSPSGTSSGSSASNANGSSCGAYQACSLISASQVGQAFGTTFGAGTETDQNKTPSQGLAEEVACNFTGTNGWSVGVTVRCCPCGDNTPQADESTAQSLGEQTTSVSGVGDSAFWASFGPDAGLFANAGTLNVFVGADLYVIVNVTTPSGTASPVTGAEQVARDVLSAL